MKNDVDIPVCITAEERPTRSHCWLRAASHVMRDFAFPFLVRLQAHSTCREIANSIPFQPPKKAPVTWGWGKGWPGVR